MAAIFKMADTTSTERPVFRLKNVGYEVKAPNFAQRTVMTNLLNLAMGPSITIFSKMAAIFKMADMIYTERTLFGLENVGYEVKAPNLHRGLL